MALTSPNVSSPSLPLLRDRPPRHGEPCHHRRGAAEGSRRQSRAPLPPRQLFLAAAHICRCRPLPNQGRRTRRAWPGHPRCRRGPTAHSLRHSLHSLSHARSGTCSVSLPSGPTTSRRQRAGARQRGLVSRRRKAKEKNETIFEAWPPLKTRRDKQRRRH
jgi:hypothetical protein